MSLEPFVLRIETLTKFSASLQVSRWPLGAGLSRCGEVRTPAEVKGGRAAGANDVGILWDLLGFHGGCDGFS